MLLFLSQLHNPFHCMIYCVSHSLSATTTGSSSQHWQKLGRSRSALNVVQVEISNGRNSMTPGDNSVNSLELDSDCPAPDQKCWLQIRVSDTGCGVQDKIACFEPFVSGRASVGLGLYLVKQHCKALGGSCGVIDTPLAKSGASFWIQVPMSKWESSMHE